MAAYRKASIRELASAAYELDSGVLEGSIHHDEENGRWKVGDVELDDWLAKYAGQEIVLIVASLQDDRPIPPRICGTCGLEHATLECPRCRQARIRLRGQ